MILVGAIQAPACPICIGFPKKTDADFLLDGHCVLLARPKDLDTFQYAPQTILKGTYDGNEIDLLVDTVTRRVLELHQDRHVLLVQETALGPWQNLGIISPEFEVVVRRLITVGVGWTGPDAASLRWQFSIPLFGQSDDRTRTLAYLELGRAPYSVIRKLGGSVSRDSLAPFLDNRQYIEWQGLAILLLAQSESAVDRQRILDSFQSCMQYGLITNLSAWVTAAIEIDPMRSMQQIDDNYFSRSDRRPEELEAVFLAVSMLGALDNAELRERIIASYGRLLEHAPQFAPMVASDLYTWKRTELVETLLTISNQPHNFDFNQLLSIHRYLRGTAKNETIGHVDD